MTCWSHHVLTWWGISTAAPSVFELVISYRSRRTTTNSETYSEDVRSFLQHSSFVHLDSLTSSDSLELHIQSGQLWTDLLFAWELHDVLLGYVQGEGFSTWYLYKLQEISVCFRSETRPFSETGSLAGSSPAVVPLSRCRCRPEGLVLLGCFHSSCNFFFFLFF